MTQSIEHFNDLLQMAHAQPEQQRLLFVFVSTELPEAATPEQVRRYEEREGGALIPLFCADKLPEEVASFDALVTESTQFERPTQRWELVFTAALPGTLLKPPTEEDAQPHLERMVEAIKTGMVESYLPFNRLGEPVLLEHAGRGA